MSLVLPSSDSGIVQNAQYFAHLSKWAYELDLIDDDVRLADFQFANSVMAASEDGIDFAIVAKFSGAFVIICRGSNDAEDWWRNFDFNQTGDYDGYVHRGFYRSANSVWWPLVKFLNKHWVPGDVVWVTGHSLGGAMATLIARWLKYIEWDIAGVYTFGQPRVGDDDYAAAYPLQDVHYRFVNSRDIVPQLPLPWMGPQVSYKHVGTSYKFDEAGVLQRGERGWSELSAEFARSVLTRGIGSAAVGTFGFSFEDHRLVHYIRKIDKHLE